jgi:hypothetical protein
VSRRAPHAQVAISGVHRQRAGRPAQRALRAGRRYATASSTSAARRRRPGCAPDRTAPGPRCCSPGPAPTATAAAAAGAFWLGRPSRTPYMRSVPVRVVAQQPREVAARPQPGAIHHQAAGVHRGRPSLGPRRAQASSCGHSSDRPSSAPCDAAHRPSFGRIANPYTCSAGARRISGSVPHCVPAPQAFRAQPQVAVRTGGELVLFRTVHAMPSPGSKSCQHRARRDRAPCTPPPYEPMPSVPRLRPRRVAHRPGQQAVGPRSSSQCASASGA